MFYAGIFFLLHGITFERGLLINTAPFRIIRKNVVASYALKHQYISAKAYNKRQQVFLYPIMFRELLIHFSIKLSKHCEKCNIAAVNCFRSIHKSQQRNETEGGANWATVKMKSHRGHAPSTPSGDWT